MNKASKSNKAQPRQAPSGSSGVTVFVVDDDDAMRESLDFLIKSVGLKVESFNSAEQFLEYYDPAMRGCLILDVRMPGMSGLELQEHLRAERIRIPIILLTAHADVPMAVRAMRGGAFDMIEKPCRDQVLLDRVRQAVDEDARARVDDRLVKESSDRIGCLSPREREVMELVVAGMPNKQIADALKISIKTVEVHRARVMEKTGAQSLAELVRMAMMVGIE